MLTAESRPSLTARHDLPTEIIEEICTHLDPATDTSALRAMCLASTTLNASASTRLYSALSLTALNTRAVFASLETATRDGQASSKRRTIETHTKSLRIESAPEVPELQPLLDPLGGAFEAGTGGNKLFRSVTRLTLGPLFTWQLILHAQRSKDVHPLIAFLASSASPAQLCVHYLGTARTKASRRSGYPCCGGFTGRTPASPAHTAAYDTTAVTNAITHLASHWNLASLSLCGVTDETLPSAIRADEVRIAFAPCRCADESYSDDWCFNHVSPCRRAEQILGVVKPAAARGAAVVLEGVERVGWTEVDDVGKVIMRTVVQGMEPGGPGGRVQGFHEVK